MLTVEPCEMSFPRKSHEPGTEAGYQSGKKFSSGSRIRRIIAAAETYWPPAALTNSVPAHSWGFVALTKKVEIRNGDSVTRPALRISYAIKEARFHRRRGAGAGVGRWSQHGHLQRRQYGSAKAA